MRFPGHTVHLLIAAVTLGAAACRSTDMHRNLETRFDEGSLDMERIWRLEGTGRAWIEGGRLTLAEDSGGVGVVLWTRADWPTDVELSFDLSFSNNRGIGVFFFAARGASGEDAFETPTNRTGAYDEYIRGDLDSYSVSLHRFFPDGEHNPGANLRRNSGFHLLNAATPDPVMVAGQTYHIRLRKTRGAIRLEVDGDLIHDYHDENPLGSGKIGFRLRGHETCRMSVDNLVISRP